MFLKSLLLLKTIEIILVSNPDVNLASTVTRPQDLSDQEAQIFTEFVQSLIYRARPLGEFVAGALYEWAYSNGDEIRGLMPGFLKVNEQEAAQLNARLNQSQAFELGRLLGEGAAIAQGIYEFIAGSAAVGGGGGLCITGIGCFAGAPAIATGVVLQAHGATLAVNSANEFGEKLSDIINPNRMASSGGADDVIGLSRETGISQGSINNVYDDLPAGDIKLLGDKLSKNTSEHLFNKGGDGSTGSQLVKDVANLIRRFSKNNDLDAIADVARTLSANKPNNKGIIDITNPQLENAFSDNISFLQKYKERVSGAFSYTFGRSKSKTLDPNQALGEIKTAEDFLDGKALLKNDGTGQSFIGEIKNLTALSDARKPGGSTKVPDHLITEINGVTRLVEVKTPTKKMLPKRIRNSVKSAVEQIVEYNTLSSPSDKGIIRLDYRSSSAPANLSASEIERVVKERLTFKVKEDSDLIGSDFIDFVEVIYKDSNQNNAVKRLTIQVNN